MNRARCQHFAKHSFYCFFLGRKNIVKLLIEKGADVNAKGEAERTPLQQSARNGNKMFKL